MQTNPFSHLALKACAESCSYALQDHKVSLKTRLEVKHAKLIGDRKNTLFKILVHDKTAVPTEAHWLIHEIYWKIMFSVCYMIQLAQSLSFLDNVIVWLIPLFFLSFLQVI